MATYSFLDVQATIVGPGGAFSIGSGAGVAEEGISIEMIEEKDLMVVGADGRIMHGLRASDAARLTLRLLKTSPTNALLSQLYNTQKAEAALWGQNVLVVSDTQRGDVESMTEAAFARQTGNTYAKDPNMQEWMFYGNRDSILGIGIPNVNV